jgi:signal transduction histidine kinase
MPANDRLDPPLTEPHPLAAGAKREAASGGFGRYARALAAPLLLWALLLVALREPIRAWLRGENTYDREALQEWLEEARAGNRETLSEMIDAYLDRARRHAELLRRPADPTEAGRLAVQQSQALGDLLVKREEIEIYLKGLGEPPTKMYPGQLPLFPLVYRLEVRPDDDPDPPLTSEPIAWDSQLPAESGTYRELEYRLYPRARVFVRYQMHAYHKRQRLEQEHTRKLQQLAVLAVLATFLGLAWVVMVQRRERERQRQRLLAQQQVDRVQRRHAETERQLLEQRLATQAAEQRALELKSQLYAGIGIMAGSYAHNIKNLLVRPNDLLRRCLEGDGLSADRAGMLHEVQQTLGTVTERLQQILRTVRRDPTRAEEAVLDLNAVVGELEATWRDLARDKWKLDLVLEINAMGSGEGGMGNERKAGEAPVPPSSPIPHSPFPIPHSGGLWVAADRSHLQQAIENLLFNARDATFEMRNHLRDAARREEGLDGAARRQALIDAAAWRGRVVLRTGRVGDEVLLEVADNGAGMTEEVKSRCTQTHFSTKRDNALYEGHSTGMGLGLSFVVAILEHHRARLEIDSQPLRGTTFRLLFPAAGAPEGQPGAPATGLPADPERAAARQEA